MGGMGRTGGYVPWWGLALAFTAVTTASGNASAQNKGFAINRFDPSERGSDWFTGESLDLRGNGRIAVGVVGDYGHKPLVLLNPNGSERAAIVEHQMMVHVGGSVVFFDRLRLGLNLPIALYQDGQGGSINGVRYASSNETTLGDLRFGVDIRLVGEYEGPFNLALGARLHAPTGSPSAFTSDGNVRVVPHLAAAGDIGPLAYAARLGINYRAEGGSFGDRTIGTEFLYNASAGVRVADKKLLLGPELYGAKSFDTGAVQGTPLEVLFGGHYKFPSGFRAGAAVGPGLTTGYGVPDVRVVASVEWFQEHEKPKPPAPPPEMPKDRDGDGIFDHEDACPDVPGISTADPKTNGCPEPDRDKDGITDRLDACPDEPGPTTGDPKTNGCPPPKDRDGDGVKDEVDACPDVPGPADADPKKNGCPDTDKDGIIDPEDACPKDPGPKDPDPKKNGCPAARIEAGQIKIVEQVKFKTGSALILPESDGILQAVKKILDEHPEITKVAIEGHTDNVGAKPMNMRLSSDRAASVVKWLTKNGVKANRLESKGFGPEQPIDTNDTDAGKQNNRRVEFHIRGGTPTATPATPAPAPKP